MMRAAIGLALLLGGCVSAPDWSAYTPEILDSGQYYTDRTLCTAYAENYKGKFDGASIVVAGVQGAANNASEAPINAVIPLAGAAGGAGSALISAVDPFGAVKRGIYVDCLRQKTAMDRSALVLEPR